MTFAFEKSVLKMSPSMKVALVADLFLFRAGARQRDHVRIVLDAEGLGAALGGGNHGAAVAGAEIVVDVVRA